MLLNESLVETFDPIENGGCGQILWEMCVCVCVCERRGGGGERWLDLGGS